MNLFSSDDLTRIELDFPGVDIHDLARQVERKAAQQAVASPVGLLRAWARKAADDSSHSASTDRETARQHAHEQPFHGWTEYGKHMRSATPFRNPTSLDGHRLIRAVTRDLLGPSEVLALAAHMHESTQRILADCAAWWLEAERLAIATGQPAYSAWPMCQNGSSFAESIRSHGGTYPWLHDENRWRENLQSVRMREGTATEGVTE